MPGGSPGISPVLTQTSQQTGEKDTVIILPNFINKQKFILGLNHGKLVGKVGTEAQAV